MLFDIVPHDEFMFALATGVPMQMFTVIMEAYLLDIRHRRVFWIAEIVLVLLAPFRTLCPAWVRFGAGLVMFIGIPMVTAGDDLLRRVFVCLAMTIAAVAIEAIIAFQWILITGQPYDAAHLCKNYPLIFLDLMSVIVYVLVIWFVGRRVVRRFRKTDSAERSSLQLPRSTWLAFVLVAVVQLALECGLMFLMNLEPVTFNATLSLLIGFVALAMFLAASVPCAVCLATPAYAHAKDTNTLGKAWRGAGAGVHRS